MSGWRRLGARSAWICASAGVAVIVTFTGKLSGLADGFRPPPKDGRGMGGKGMPDTGIYSSVISAKTIQSEVEPVVPNRLL